MDVFRISKPQKQTVKLKLGMRAYSLLIEEYPLAEQYCVQLDKNHWIFEANVCGFTGVGRFVLGLIDEVKVLAPNSFNKYLHEKINRNENNDSF